MKAVSELTNLEEGYLKSKLGTKVSGFQVSAGVKLRHQEHDLYIAGGYTITMGLDTTVNATQSFVSQA